MMAEEAEQSCLLDGITTGEEKEAMTDEGGDSRLLPHLDLTDSEIISYQT